MHQCSAHKGPWVSTLCNMRHIATVGGLFGINMNVEMFQDQQKKSNSTAINQPNALCAWDRFTKIPTHWAQFCLPLFRFFSSSWEHGFCVPCPLLPPLLRLLSHKEAAE